MKSYVMCWYTRRSEVGGGKAAITVNVDVWSIRGINQELVKVQFQMKMVWKDPRLTFLDLKEDTNLNIVSTKHARNIWHPPPIVFLNAEPMYKTEVSSYLENQNQRDKSRSVILQIYKGSFSVQRNGSHQNANSWDELHNIRLYNGGENYIVHSIIFSKRFICSFDFKQYPFDVQRCTMDFILMVCHCSRTVSLTNMCFFL